MKKISICFLVCLLNGCVVSTTNNSIDIYCLSGNSSFSQNSVCWNGFPSCSQFLERCETPIQHCESIVQGVCLGEQWITPDCSCDLSDYMFCTEKSGYPKCYSSEEICLEETETGICERINSQD